MKQEKNHTDRDIRRFSIPNVPPTTNKTIRFPNNIIEQVEREIGGKACTFTAFVVAAVSMALKDLQQQRCEQDI